MYDSIQYLSKITTALSENQRVISNNIANSQTPGYVKQESTFLDVLGRLENPYESQLSKKMGAMTPKKPSTNRPVDIAEEFLNMQKYFLDYNLVTRRMSTVFNNIRRATQVGR